MNFSERLEAAYDLLRPNLRGLKKYLLRDGKKHPFAVICPGGGYNKVCSYVEGLPFAKKLNAMGYHAVVVYYRIGERALYPAPQEDLAWALDRAFAHAEEWRLDTDNWSLWGSSAGGHLAASFLAEGRAVRRPNALILIYPVIIMDENTHANTRRNLLGPEPSGEMYERLSVERHITGDFPPTFVWNGRDDRSVDPKNSRALETALGAAGVICRAEEYEGVGHGAGLAEGTNAEPWFAHAVSFWEENACKARKYSRPGNSQSGICAKISEKT